MPVVLAAADGKKTGDFDGGSGGGTMPPVDHAERIATLEAAIPTLATKADLASVEGRLISTIERGINETQRWTIATVIGLFIGFGGLFLAMSNALKPTPAAPQQPAVIVVPQLPAAPASR